MVFLTWVMTKSGDVVMVRPFNDVWELLRYDVTGSSITEAARSPSGRGRDNGYLGAVALGNGDIVLGRQGGGCVKGYTLFSREERSVVTGARIR